MSANIPLAQLERLLFDDAPYGDLTTDLLGIGAQRGRMTFSARGPMVLALATEAAEILEMAGASVERLVEDGQALTPGQEFLRAEGQAGALLRGWKVAQTLVEIWSGVATAAREIVEAARAVAPDICVACTRKNTPGLKNFSVAAIRAGGAEMHRLGLSETILVFPEHLAFVGGETLDSVAARLRRGAPEKKLVLEARDDRGSACGGGSGSRCDPGGEIFARRHRPVGQTIGCLDKKTNTRRRWRRQSRQCRRICDGGRGYSRHISALCCPAARRLCRLYAQ